MTLAWVQAVFGLMVLGGFFVVLREGLTNSDSPALAPAWALVAGTALCVRLIPVRKVSAWVKVVSLFLTFITGISTYLAAFFWATGPPDPTETYVQVLLVVSPLIVLVSLVLLGVGQEGDGPHE